MSDGTFTVRNGNFFFTYTHHCFWCETCQTAYDTFSTNHYGFKPCEGCGRPCVWLTNEAALAKGILHEPKAGCPLCEIERMVKVKA